MAKKSRFWVKKWKKLRFLMIFPVFGHFLRFLTQKNKNISQNPLFGPIFSLFDAFLSDLEQKQDFEILTRFYVKTHEKVPVDPPL